MIIDVHTHVCDEETWKEYQKISGGKVDNLISIPYFNKESHDAPRIPDTEELLEFAKGKPQIFVLGSIDMETDLENQLEKMEKFLKDGKIIGIKLYPGYQHFYPYDDKVLRIAELCEKYGKPLVFHSGECFDPDERSLMKYANPIYIDELAKMCPKTKIIVSHFGFPYFLEAANVIAYNENVYADISSILVKFQNRRDTKKLEKQCFLELERAFTYYPIIRGKIMFGTDFAGEHSPLCLVDPYIRFTKKLFPKKERDGVFSKLAEKLYFDGK